MWIRPSGAASLHDKFIRLAWRPATDERIIIHVANTGAEQVSHSGRCDERESPIECGFRFGSKNEDVRLAGTDVVSIDRSTECVGREQLIFESNEIVEWAISPRGELQDERIHER
jgi:hypothetical protein